MTFPDASPGIILWSVRPRGRSRGRRSLVDLSYLFVTAQKTVSKSRESFVLPGARHTDC